MRYALVFLSGAGIACFFVRSAASSVFDSQAKDVLRNYGLIFLALAGAVAIAAFAAR